MNIVVLVKQVPDTWSERKLRAEDSTLDRDAADAVINELDDYAIEEGLRLQEAVGGEVTIVSMGPDKAADAIRKALSMGADKAVHVSDDALRGSDGLVTSAVLAKVLERTGFDLAILGLGVDGRADGHPGGDAVRAARCSADVVRQQGGDGRIQDQHSPSG